ncbi:MAG TPA: nuclear transport factor 2 family protein [Caulobacteraceae bacterium]|nr:nuclear transport factor 2 family protein [Caulobacteraceae bacterium]
MRRLALIATASAAIAAPAVAQTQGAAAPTTEVFEILAARDQELFAALFDRCDADHLATMVAADFEFYHDKGGQTADSGAAFIAGVRQMCEGQKAGTNYRARRELVPGSLQLHMINNYGAVQMGDHRFFKLTPGRPEALVETGRFVNLWKNENGAWKLARVISYDHRLAK